MWLILSGQNSVYVWFYIYMYMIMRTCVGEYVCVCVCVSSIMHVSIMRVQVSIRNAQQNTRWASRCPCIIHNPLYPAYDSLRHSSHNSHGFSIRCLAPNEPKSRSREARNGPRLPPSACVGVRRRRPSGCSDHLSCVGRVGSFTTGTRYRCRGEPFNRPRSVSTGDKYHKVSLFTAMEFVLHHLLLGHDVYKLFCYRINIRRYFVRCVINIYLLRPILNITLLFLPISDINF